ncbi:SEC-C metal-binding domain-containing protein [Rhodococcus opacus]|uniref:SEC-C metal-binding domain-containing protein n=1 Tax=Rhodococcus opacus TaxID=37919 RepID=A0AAX3YUR4_RHOOP|nr:SEC-C metal-binding domain-containing protein [Rhodococcus opacus]MCZ4586141.1 SEC-C metal-binding domain-containing protein [Rhodococcus opacus]WLF51922.1 SEC-C metal-binding domain-containing protein [Rhodococcus opacus]
MTDPTDPTAEAAMVLLREHGPMHTDEWARRLVAEGHGYLADMEELAEYIGHPRLGYLADGRSVALDALLAGRVLTHRLTEAEIASGILDAHPDLTPLLPFDDHDPAAGGLSTLFRDLDDDVFDERGVDDPDWPTDAALLLEPDALVEFRAGDLVALAFVEGELRLTAAAAPPAPAPDLAVALADLVPMDRPEPLDGIIWQLMADDRALFAAPTTPLGDLITDAGYVCDGDDIAVRGFDFAAHRGKAHAATVTAAHHLTDDETEAVMAFIALIGVLERTPDDERERAVDAVVTSTRDRFAGLARPNAARAAFGEAYATCRAGSETLHLASAVLRDRGPRKIAPTAHWLAGKAAELDGRTADAERHYERALAVDPNWDEALEALARFASDRGDAVRAIGLLDRVEGAYREPLYDLLQSFLPVDRPDLGRNDRCWCGSGLKYKACHLGKTEHPLEQRAGWLYQKAGSFAQGIEWRPLLISLAQIRSAHDDDPMALYHALDDPLVADVVMFECGAFARFVAERGVLLPADELLLAQQWLLAERSVHEVEAVRPGEGLTLRDVRTGDRLEVTERTASRQLRAGDFFCARVVPAGSTMQIFGGIEPIEPGQRGRLIELLDSESTDPEELVEFLSARFAPPRLVTPDGHPMVACRAVFEVADTAGIRRKLSRRFGAADADRWTWTEQGSVLGVLNLAPCTEPWVLEVEAMNEPRFESLVDAVAAADPGARLREQTRTPAAELMAQAQENVRPTHPVDPDDPAIAAALDEHIRGYEQQWLDDSIPALGDHTPRECAADPTRRDDLIRLLDSFPQEERPGAMSVRRLREALGL